MHTDQEEILKVMREPFIEDWSPSALRAKKKLFIYSAISFLYNLFIKTSSSIKLSISLPQLSGVDLEIPTNLFNFIIFVLVFYSLINFYLHCREHYNFAKIKLTAIKFQPSGGFFHTSGRDYPLDQKNSSLYAFLAEKLEFLFKSIHEVLTTEIQCLKRIKQESIETRGNLDVLIENCQKDRISLSSTLNLLRINSDEVYGKRFEASLERFDKGFKCFNKVQRIRWITIEYSIPIIIGFLAIACINPSFRTFFESIIMKLAIALERCFFQF